jgi:hypothetical protein
MDEQLERLRRATESSPDDTVARYKYRQALIRAGIADDLHDDDIVLVSEVETPWISHPWYGVVLRAFPQGDKYIRPLPRQKILYRVTPSRQYVKKGLYLTREDTTWVVFPTPYEYDAQGRRTEAEPLVEVPTLSQLRAVALRWVKPAISLETKRSTKSAPNKPKAHRTKRASKSRAKGRS